MSRRSFSLAFLVLAVGPLAASRGDDAWDACQFLVGEWVGEGTGKPGEGEGAFSMELALQGKILVRKNRSDYPATKERAAFSHEDLMVVYRGDNGAKTRAIYFDSEGHVIRYAIKASEDKRTLTFLSDPAPSSPRFRLTYVKAEGEALRIKFEIAPPDKPETFQTYLDGSARRRPRREAETPKK
jgi:hypothetical protein